MSKQWIVTVEPPKGASFKYRKTTASTLEEASANVRAKIPANWRVVGAEEQCNPND